MSTSVDVIDLQSVGFIEAISEISTSVDMPNQDHTKAVRVMSTGVDQTGTEYIQQLKY